MRSDPDFGKRISKKVEEIKVDKQNLLNVADEYAVKYEKEILEGTELRKRLLTEGSRRGLSETQVFQEYGRFCPTIYTPLLNFLYFMLRETEDVDRDKYRHRDAINEALIRAGQLTHDSGERDLSSSELSQLLDDKFKELKEESLVDERRQEANRRFAEEEREEAELKEPEDMESYLFGHITLDQFDTLKKLKALTHSSNIEEATLAFKKGKELALKYKVDWEKIPCYYRQK